MAQVPALSKNAAFFINKCSALFALAPAFVIMQFVKNFLFITCLDTVKSVIISQRSFILLLLHFFFKDSF